MFSCLAQAFLTSTLCFIFQTQNRAKKLTGKKFLNCDWSICSLFTLLNALLTLYLRNVGTSESLLQKQREWDKLLVNWSET